MSAPSAIPIHNRTTLNHNTLVNNYLEIGAHFDEIGTLIEICEPFESFVVFLIFFCEINSIMESS